MATFVSPLYTIHRFRDDIYKVVAFKGDRNPEKVFLRDLEEQQHNDAKLDSNFSRARSMVLQYALCNSWEYFFTGTLDPDKWNRNDLSSFMTQLSQKIRDWRKDYGFKLDVLLVPEQHKDGTWHIHGLINNLPRWCLYHFYWLPLREIGLTAPYPQKLCEGDWFTWADFQDTFGFCSLAPVRDPVATAFYITKYVSKDLSRREGDLGKHLYFHSRPLNKAEKASDIYLYNPGLDEYCTHDHDFCKTGMVEDTTWTFPYLWDGVEIPNEEPLNPPVAAPLVPDPDFRPWTIDPFYEQQRIPGL